MYRVMTKSACNPGDREVLESIIWFRVQQFLDWRRESDFIDIHLKSLLRPN
jgi:hypothetical protein